VIILDTNVLSALMKRGTEFTVDNWLDRQNAELLWTTTITVFEIRFGIDLLASGRQKQQLEIAFARCLKDDLQERIFDFDRDAAREAATMAARRQLAGRPVEFRDMEIAGIAAVRRATLATRNTRHFENLGIGLIDPWLIA
jgi:toxin FitB